MKEQMAALGIEALKALSPVILALIGWIGVRLNQYIAAKVKNEKMQGMLSRLNDVAVDAVKEVEQTFMGALEKPTKEDMTKAKDMALASIKTHMGQRGLNEMKKVMGIANEGDLEKMLLSLLESRVLDLKMAKKSIGGAK